MAWAAVLVAAIMLAPASLSQLPGLTAPEPSLAPQPLAVNATTVDVLSLPSATFVGSNFTVSWDVNLPTNESASNITATGVAWDTVSHAPGPFDRLALPGAAAGSVVAGTVYNATFGASAPAGLLYLVFWANVSGTEYYNGTESLVEVRLLPSLARNDALSDTAILFGDFANLTVDAQWPYGENLTQVRLLWDDVPHGTNGTVAGDWANAEPGQDGPGGSYTFMIAPANAGNVYYTFAADAMGQTFLAPTEYTLQVAGEPLVTKDSSPPWVLVGSSPLVRWSVVVDDFVDFTTQLRYDNVSHAAPRSEGDYPQVAATFTGQGSQSFEAPVPAPGGSDVYFFIVANAGNRSFTITDLGGESLEFRIEVRPLPVLQVAAAPAHGFVGRNLTVQAEAAWPYPDLMDEISLQYGPTSQGSAPSLPLTYTAAVALAGAAAGQHNLTIPAEAAAGTVYFTLYARIGSVEVLSAEEYSLSIYEQPAVAVAGPAWVVPSSQFTANVTVGWSGTGPLDAVLLYYGTESDAPAPDPSNYAGSDEVLSRAAGVVPFTVQAPSLPGPFYLLAAVESAGETFVAPAEAVVDVLGAPVIDRPILMPAQGVALFGQNVSVSWKVNFTENVSISSGFVWDLQSHASGGGFDYRDYAYATPLQAGRTGEMATASFDAPEQSTMVFGVVHAVLGGRDYYSDSEIVLEVIAPPVLHLLWYPETVEVGEPIHIEWNISFGGPYSLIPHTAIHWGLTSKAGLPVTFTSYPGVGGPFKGTHTNEFNASIPALDTPGEVYFIVHAVVNNVNFYLNETVVHVRLPSDAGGGGFLPGPDAAATAAAAAVAAAAATIAGRRRRD